MKYRYNGGNDYYKYKYGIKDHTIYNVSFYQCEVCSDMIIVDELGLCLHIMRENLNKYFEPIQEKRKRIIEEIELL